VPGDDDATGFGDASGMPPLRLLPYERVLLEDLAPTGADEGSRS
jgi:hypothetical protein